MIATGKKLMKTARKQNGFTLTEILVTIAVMLIAAAIAVPNAARLVASYQLYAAANDVAFEISRAKMQAVAQNQFVQLTVREGTLLYRQTKSSSTASWTDAAGFVKLPHSTSASGVGPTFDRNGLASSAGMIVVRNGVGSKAIAYNILGRVTISGGEGST
jgi:prepilin-type N-terminal cleavage/methylation domain-containing protein